MICLFSWTVQRIGGEDWKLVFVRENLGHERRGRLGETISWDGDGSQVVSVVAVDTDKEGLVVVVGGHERERENLDRCIPAGSTLSNEKNLVRQVGIDLEGATDLGRGVLAQVLVEHEGLGGIGSKETGDRRHDVGGMIVWKWKSLFLKIMRVYFVEQKRKRLGMNGEDDYDSCCVSWFKY